jgi:hypothetical protein
MPAPKLTQAQAAALGIEPRFRYDSLIDRIVAAQGEFIPINPDDLRGGQTVSKRSFLRRATRNRGVRLTTTCPKPGTIYARLVVNQ